MTSIRFLLYMYVCDACRGAAVAITNPGLVGVWKWASLSFSFIICYIDWEYGAHTCIMLYVVDL
jgi:hypothetical protein